MELQNSGMRVLAAFLMMTSGLSAVKSHRSFTRSDIRHCGRHRYFNETSAKCEACDYCTPGYFVKSKCKGTKNTECRKCPTGYYSTISSNTPGRCRQCSDCGLRNVESPCTNHSNARCGECPLGTYWDYVKNDCTECTYCFPEYGTSWAIELSCDNINIPSTHRCARPSWMPYKPPHLVKLSNEDGEAYFISSADLKTSKAARRVSTSITYTATKVSSSTTTSTPRNTNPTTNLNASMEEVISRFTELYNAHCRRTFILASVFCACVLFLALVCVSRKRSRVYNSDCKSLLRSDTA